ncbi:hypothetical protein [Pantoea vagans]|uniref:hypothetical protein n=1 Tax=Pantoea vagans TaxID=470934 RepID=UPI00065FE3AD|nr:hypothetical protein [Pantoea vagans]
MTNLTPSEARRLIDKLHHNQTKEHGISILEEKYLAALEIALTALEQQAETAKSIECPFPCGWKELLRISMSDGAFLATDLLEGGEIKDFHRHAALSNTDRLVSVITAILNVQEAKSSQRPSTDTYRQIENDGWTDWVGGDCPVGISDIVECKKKSGDISKNVAVLLAWEHLGYSGDIIAYRVIENDGREG